MFGLDWLDESDACDLLRVSEDNIGVIEQHTETIPYYVEITTGYPAELAKGMDCDETVKQLCRFVLQQWFNPDGTDATKIARVVTSLTKAVKALVIAQGMDGVD